MRDHDLVLDVVAAKARRVSASSSGFVLDEQIALSCATVSPPSVK